jgi:hypothetical protein
MTLATPLCCGIDIAGRRAVFVLLRREADRIADLTGRHTQLQIENPDEPKALRRFRRSAHALLDRWQPDRIAIVERRKSGRFAAGGTTFKLEGLLQVYAPADVTLVAPVLLRQFSKEQRPKLTPRFQYQKNAYLLAHYLLAGFEAGPPAGT